MKKLLITVYFIIIGCFCCYAQLSGTAYLKTLETALQKSAIDTSRVHILNKLGNYYVLRNYLERKSYYLDSALVNLQKAVALSTQLHLDTGAYGKNENEILLGKAYMALDDTAKGKLHYMIAINYYHNHHNPLSEVKTWSYLGDTYIYHSYPVEQRESYLKAIAIAKRYHYIDREIELRYKLAAILFSDAKYDEAIAACKNILHDFPDRPSSEVDELDQVYWLLAATYRYKGSLNKALYYGLECIRCMELHHENYWNDKFYGELAQIYDDLGQTEKSIFWYKKALAIRENKDTQEEYIYRTVAFIVQGLIKLGKSKEALEEITALEHRRAPVTPLGSAVVYQSKAYCYEALKNYPLAESNYLKMIRLYQTSISITEITAIAFYDISRFYVEQKRYADAAKYLNDTVSGHLTLSVNKNFQYLYFKVDSASGRYIDAMRHFGNYKALNDSMFNITKSKQIEELQIKYETDKKENDIKVLQKQRAGQQEKVTQANLIRNLTLCGTLLLLLTLGLLYNSYRINQKKTKEIDIKNNTLGLLIDEKDELLAEKEDLIKEIHHRVKNNLQIVMALLQRQSTFITNEDALLAIRDSEHRMHSIALIHQKLYQADSFTIVNMVEYIDELTGYLRDSYDLGNQVRFEKYIENIELELNIAVPLGLILNEAITNAIKYGFTDTQKGTIFIALNQVADHAYVLKISDNGSGLPDDFDIKKNSSMGFNLMTGLSKQVGGSFKIEGENGVVITIDFRTDLGAKVI